MCNLNGTHYDNPAELGLVVGEVETDIRHEI